MKEAQPITAAPQSPVSTSTLQAGPEAKPCPFCGSNRIVKGERYFAMCVDCGATGPERNSDAPARKFFGDWNRRTQPEVERLTLANLLLKDHIDGLAALISRLEQRLRDAEAALLAKGEK